MQAQPQRLLAVAGFLLLGIGLGAMSGFLLGQMVLKHSARKHLEDYAADLIRQSDSYSEELSRIAKTFNPSQFPFCSHEEIVEMQVLAFRSRQVKDIGRTRDGKLYCSGAIGILAKPLPMPQIALVSPRGMRVYINAPVLVAPSSRAVLLDFQGVDIVLSPTAFDTWARPHLGYTVVITNRSTTEMVRIAGDKLEMDVASVLAEKEESVSGVFYRSRCSAAFSLCVITSQSASSMSSVSDPVMLGYLGLGSMAGLGLTSAVTLIQLQRRGIAHRLRRAIRRDELHLVYQPIFDLTSRRCVSLEALVRWSDQDGTSVPADQFVRIAEERGFIRELTALVVRRAMTEMGGLLNRYADLTLSLNIAAADLMGESLFELLERNVAAAGIRPDQVVLELTERSTGDLAVVRDAVLRLHRFGYKVHIDDFGTGFSSLSYLHQLAVDAIKVDRAFTRTIGTDAVTASILPQILTLAQNLQLGVVVEGVETESQVSYLVSTEKPMLVQGWYFGHPVPGSTLQNIMQEARSAAATESSKRVRSIASGHPIASDRVSAL